MHKLKTKKENTHMNYLKLTLIFVVIALSAVAQTNGDERLQKAISDTRAYIKKLAESVGPDVKDKDAPSPEDVQRVRAAINAAEDAFIESNVNPQHLEQKATEKLIRTLDYETPKNAEELAAFVKQFGRRPDDDNGDLTHVFVSSAGGETSLIVGYWLGGTWSESDITIRAYKAVAGRFALTAETGSSTDSELRGMSLFMREVPGPIASETWLLAWGEGQTSNGLGGWGLRLYAYDGNKFRTVWKDVVYGLRLTFTKNGFTLTHGELVDGDLNFVSDEYTLTPAGPKQIARDIIQADQYFAIPDVPK